MVMISEEEAGTERLNRDTPRLVMQEAPLTYKNIPIGSRTQEGRYKNGNRKMTRFEMMEDLILLHWRGGVEQDGTCARYVPTGGRKAMAGLGWSRRGGRERMG